MPKDNEARILVERMMKGDVRPNDLASLVRFVRFRHGGVTSVKDLGDFLGGHDDNRDRGAACDAVTDNYAMMRMHRIRMSWRLHQTQLPVIAKRAINAAFNRRDNGMLLRELGMRKKDVGRLVKELNNAFSENPDGTLKLGPITPDAFNLFGYLSCSPILSSCYTEASLFMDFCDVLMRNKLLAIKERHSLRTIKKPLAALALHAMHRTELTFFDGAAGRLIVSAWIQGNNEMRLGVLGYYTVPEPWPPWIALEGSEGASVFNTELAVSTYCDPELVKIDNWGDVPLELDDQFRLRPMRA